MQTARIATLTVLLIVGLLTAACGGAESTATTTAAQPTATTAMAAEPTATTATAAQPTATTAMAAEPTATTATAAQPTGTTAAGGGAAAEATVNVPAATIRVGTWESGDALKTWQGLIADFNKQYPQIKVSFEPVPDN